MRKIVFLASFFAITPIMLLLCVVYVLFLSYHTKSSFTAVLPNTVAYAALPSAENTFKDQIVQEDSRTEMVRQFFAKYDSPLAPFAQNVIDAAEKYNMDFRLIPAIAMQESNLCKKEPPGSFNCWGYGMYDGKVKKFAGYATAIDAVTQTLAEEYATQGLHSPQEIMSKYTPSSNGSWANGVNFFLNQLQ